VCLSLPVVENELEPRRLTDGVCAGENWIELWSMPPKYGDDGASYGVLWPLTLLSGNMMTLFSSPPDPDDVLLFVESDPPLAELLLVARMLPGDPGEACSLMPAKGILVLYLDCKLTRC